MQEAGRHEGKDATLPARTFLLVEVSPVLFVTVRRAMESGQQFSD